MSNQPGCSRNRRSFTSRTALERLNQVDALFRARGGTVSVSQAQDALGFSRSCIHDCLRELLRREQIIQAPDGSYWLPGTRLEDKVAQLEDKVAQLDAENARLRADPTAEAWSRISEAVGLGPYGDPSTVAERVEGLREREGYAGAHVELLQQFESEAVCRLAEARVRLEMLECQVVALRQAQLRGAEGA